MSIIAQFAALTIITFIVFGFIGSFVNYHVVLSKMMRQLFFVKKQKANLKNSKPVQNIHLLRVNFFNKCFKFSKHNNDEKLNKREAYEIAERRIEKELCILNIVQQLQKIKCTLDCMMRITRCDLNDVKNKFFSMQTIDVDHPYNRKDSSFIDFIHKDTKTVYKEKIEFYSNLKFQK